MLGLAVRNRVARVLVALAIVALSARDAAAGVVYALDQINGGANQIYGFRINPTTGALTLLAGFPVASGGLGGAGSFSEHITYKNGLLFVVNEGSSSLSVFSVSPSGALSAKSFSPIMLSGDLGCVAADATAANVVVGGNAGLWSIVLTSSSATVAPGSPSPTSGASPFSCALSSNGLYAYTGGNVGSVIAGFAVTPSTGVLTPLSGSPFNTAAGNPVGYATDSAGRLFTSNFGTGVRAFTSSSGSLTAVTGNPFASGLSGGVQGVLHPSGFYIVADRSANRLGVYQIAGSGSATTLTAVSGSPFTTGGSFTDAVTLAGPGFVVAANGISRNLTTFQVDTSTGALTSLGAQPVNSVGSSGLITGITYASRVTTAGDFEGDRKSDLTVFRPALNTWFTLQSMSNYTTFASFNWGAANDKLVPGDYDGDGKDDPAIYRPSTGTWFVANSSTNFTTFFSLAWGNPTDTPVGGKDFDGDGKADPAVFRPSTAGWHIALSSTNYTTFLSMTLGGQLTDVPVAADYDGDGRADLAVYRPTTGQWAVLQSSAGYTLVIYVWGNSTDVTVPGDYDGDGRADPAVYRASTNTWLILESVTNYTTFFSVAWGASGDVNGPSDYDGDGKFDLAVYRPGTGTWLILKSSSGYSAFASYSWGNSTDTPINKRP